MALSERPYAPRGSSQLFFPVAVKWLLISNFAIFVLTFLGRAYGFDWIFYPFGLIPGMAAGRELLRGRTEFGVKLGLYGTFTGGCREPAFGYAA